MAAYSNPFDPDLVLLDGNVWTVNPAQPRAEAVACRDGKIVFVGLTSDARRLAGASTRVIDLGGKLVVPGFNDAHVHLLDGGRSVTSVQLRDASSEAEFRDRIGAFARQSPAGHWITGGDWDHERWTPARLPTRQLVDAVTGDHPVFVQRLDAHMALANSVTLRLVGITRDTPDPPGGTIVRDASGEATGILKDAAMAAVVAKMPPLGADEMRSALKAAMRYAAENGVTSVQDMSAAPEVVRAYQDLLSAGELTVRVSGHQPLSQHARLSGVGIRAAMGNDKLQIGAVKGFADGSLGSTTALFFEPYLDEPGTCGLAAEDMIPESRMRERIAAADAAGIQVAVHAIGDRANATVLEMFETVAAANGRRDRRFRIEHAQH